MGVATVVASVPDEQWVRDVGPVPGAEIVPWDFRGPPPERGGEIRFAVPPYMAPRERLRALRHAPALEMVQFLSAGYDGVLEHLPDGVGLANAAGVHDASTAELAVGLALASLRGIPEALSAQAEARWKGLGIRPALADSRVLLLGYGSIGHAIAARLVPFEVQLTVVASRARAGDGTVDVVHGADELPELLPHQDVVIVIVPLGPMTTGMVDAGFLAAMRDGALLVNVARGQVVDTAALLRETATGRLRAALDVTEPEPLPDGHPLWKAPGVIVTPHAGGATTAFRPRALRLIREQLQAYAAGQPLRNIVHEG
jgi:phosphoglycerate dehydrogenase-like enzyme